MSRAIHLAVVFFASAVLNAGMPAQQPAPQEPGFRIVVIEGEGAVNIIQQKTAVAPVVEVRDRNNVPVAGVTVIFTVGGQSATFAGGASMVTATTNALGQAVVTGLTPTATGAVTISANAVVQGQVLAATITQTNFATQAAAAAAAAGGGAAGGGAAGGGAGSVSAPATTGAAAGGGGGLSGTTIGIFGGVLGAGAIAAATQLGGGEAAPAPNQPPTLAAVQRSPAIGLQSATSIAFTAQTSDPNGDALTFQWAFGDGGTSTAAAPSYVYNTSGTFTVRLTVSDGSATATGETSVTIRNVTGRWVGIWRSDTGGDTGVTIDAVQNGTAVSGSSIVTTNRGPFNCAIIGGSVSAPKFVVFANDAPCAAFGGTTFAQWRGILDDSLNRVEHTFSNGPFFLVRQ